jgi:hypothetical protein
MLVTLQAAQFDGKYNSQVHKEMKLQIGLYLRINILNDSNFEQTFAV